MCFSKLGPLASFLRHSCLGWQDSFIFKFSFVPAACSECFMYIVTLYASQRAMREKWSSHLSEEKTEAPRCGVRHMTSINSGSCGSSISSGLVPGRVPQLLTCPPFLALARLLFLELSQDAGAGPREASQGGKEFASLSEVWSHLCFATCPLHFVRACSHFLNLSFQLY